MLIGFFLNIGIMFVATLIITSILSPIVIAAIGLSMIYLVVKFSQFVKTTTELKRLTQLSGAPVISIASELI